MTKEIGLKIVEKLLRDNFEIYNFDKKALNAISEECGNYNLKYFSNDEIYTWLNGICDGLKNFRD